MKFRFRPRRRGRRRIRWGRAAVALAGNLAACFGLVRLTAYALDLISVRRTGAWLRQAYQATAIESAATASSPPAACGRMKPKARWNAW